MQKITSSWPKNCNESEKCPIPFLNPTILFPTEMKPRNVQQREKTGQEKREKGEERKHKEKFGVLPMPKIQNRMFARNKEQRNA